MITMGKSFGGARLFSLTLLIAVAVTLVLRRSFGQTPPASFSDLYLLGLLLVSYYCSWKLSVALLVVSAGLAVFLLSPLDWIDGFQIVSYTVSGSVVIWVIAQLKRPAALQRPAAMHPRTLPVQDVSSSLR
jgi:hypothetical protein